MQPVGGLHGPKHKRSDLDRECKFIRRYGVRRR